MAENIYTPAFIRGLFNHMSASYERMNYITSFGFSIRWRKQFLNVLPQTNEPIRVLDLLTGMGETWNATRRKFPAAEMHALDFSEGMLHYAQRKNTRKFHQQINLIHEDVLANSLLPDQYDVITCAFGLKTFDEEQLLKLAGEVKRILKPGGHFTFIEVSTPAPSVLRMLYAFYLSKIIPVIGKLFLGDAKDYRMLWTYTSRFNNSKQAYQLFKSVGLDTHYKSYFWGCATGVYGKK